MIDEKSTKAEVLEAINQDCDALQFASEELKGDREFMLEVFGQNSLAFLHASDKLKADRGFIMEAVKLDGYVALMYASAELKADREVVVAAVNRNWDALHCASKELQAEIRFTIAQLITGDMAKSNNTEVKQ